MPYRLGFTENTPDKINKCKEIINDKRKTDGLLVLSLDDKNWHIWLEYENFPTFYAPTTLYGIEPIEVSHG